MPKSKFNYVDFPRFCTTLNPVFLVDLILKKTLIMAQAETGRRSRITIIAVDQSECSEQGFECEYVVPFSCKKKMSLGASHSMYCS